MNGVLKWKNAAHSKRESIVFCFGSTGRDLCLELALPNDRTVGNTNRETSSTFDASRIMFVLLGPETCEVGVDITINVEVAGWAKDQSLVHCVF